MVDTNRTRVDLQAILADNSTGNISPQDLRDMLASVPVLNPPDEVSASTYTFGLADADKTKIFNSASAQTITIPTDASVAFPIGTRIRCLRKGTGLPTITAAGGVTFNKPLGIKPNRFMGAMAKKSADQTADFTTLTVISWDSEVYDTDGFHDIAVNNERLTIPTGLGIKKVNVGFSLRLSSLATSETSQINILKNNSAAYDGISSEGNYSGASSSGLLNTGSSASIPVVGGDYFSGRLLVYADTSSTILANSSTFGIEATEIDPVGSITYQYGYVTLEKINTNEWYIEGPALG